MKKGISILLSMLIFSLCCTAFAYDFEMITTPEIKKELKDSISTYLHDFQSEADMGISNYKTNKQNEIQLTIPCLTYTMKNINSIDEFLANASVDVDPTYLCVSGKAGFDVKYENNAYVTHGMSNGGEQILTAYNQLKSKFNGKNLQAYYIQNRHDVFLMTDGENVLVKPLSWEDENGYYVFSETPILTGAEWFTKYKEMFDNSVVLTQEQLNNFENVPLGGGLYEITPSEPKSPKYNWIIYSVLGLIFVSAISVYIFKKIHKSKQNYDGFL